MSISGSYNNIRLGKKIGWGFGLVGILFVAVMAMFWSTLSTTQDRYEKVLHVNERMKSNAFKIGRHMLQARRSDDPIM